MTRVPRRVDADPSGNHYYLEIILPGSIVGLIVGYATQRWGVAAAPAVLR